MTSPGESFPLTRLSVLVAARSADSAQRSRALDSLFAAYWKPIYKYLRLKYSKAPQDAQDLTQGFFAELLERDLLSRFDPAKSRLRTYLRVCADSFALNEIKAASRKKRGGEITHIALDFSAAEDELRAQADRKSTRLNSSHLGISYAGFCLKKKMVRHARRAGVSPRVPRPPHASKWSPYAITRISNSPRRATSAERAASRSTTGCRRPT